jgi:hypothetical protein
MAAGLATHARRGDGSNGPARAGGVSLVAHVQGGRVDEGAVQRRYDALPPPGVPHSDVG